MQNDLPIATDVHLHGLNVENRFDGVGPISQDLIVGRAFVIVWPLSRFGGI